MDEASPYYRAPPGIWPDVDGQIWQGLVELPAMLAAALDTASGQRPTPLEIGLKLNEIAQGIFAQLAPEERDLRQVITTLRTGHALAWDMYDAIQAEQVTVAQHMQRLRETIDEFEKDLKELQRKGAA